MTDDAVKITPKTAREITDVILAQRWIDGRAEKARRMNHDVLFGDAPAWLSEWFVTAARDECNRRLSVLGVERATGGGG